MSDFAARIRRVRMKAGADVHILANKQHDCGDKDWRGLIVEHARAIAESATDEVPLVGFFVIGMFQDATYNTGFRIDDRGCPIPRTLLPAYIEEIIRRETLMKGEAESVFDEMFQWQE